MGCLPHDRGQVRFIAMVDASFSRQRQREDDAAWPIRQLWIFAVAVAVILAGLGFALLKRDTGGDATVLSTAVPAGRQVSIDLLETTKGLQVTQQQAVDQLQVVQDQLAAQKAETKRLAEEIAALTEKLGALQQPVSDIPASSVAATGSQPKSRRQ
jgi:septal ring factor EnvC (AmiA/AmiB activator)